MKLGIGMGDFFALDVGTNAIRVVQLNATGTGQWSLVTHAYIPIDGRLATSDSPEAKRKLGEVIMTAVGQSGIRTKNVVIGLPSNKTFTTVIDVPNISDAELKATMKYQIDQYIPMAVDDAKVDWALLGPSLREQNQQEVLISSTAKSYSEDRMEMIEALGLNVIAAEPDPIAMVRALTPPNAATTAMVMIDMGEMSTDLAITYGDAPRLVRTIPTGISSLIKAATQSLSVQEDQARQFILKFGLAPDRLEGQVFQALESTLDGFAAEVSKSVKFFQTRYPNIPISATLQSGFAAIIPKFGEYMESKTGIKTAVANPWQGVRLSNADQQQLAAVASEFTIAVGLAKRGNW